MSVVRRMAEIPARSAFDGSDALPIWQRGRTRQTSLYDLTSYLAAGIKGEPGERGPPGPAGERGPAGTVQGAETLTLNSSGDAALNIQTSSAPTSFAIKQLISSPNIANGNDLLLRFLRPSDGSARDIIFSSEAPGTVVTTGNPRLIGPISVRDYGAKMDASVNDAPAYNAARLAVQKPFANKVIEIPWGVVNTTDVNQGADPVLWLNNSNSFVQFFGGQGDVVEGFIAGSKYWGMNKTSHGCSPVLRLDHEVTHSFSKAATGLPESNIFGVKINQTITAEAERLDDFPWAVSVSTRSKCWGEAQIVGIASQMIRPKDALKNHPINPDNGLPYPCSQLWAHYIELNDETGLSANDSGSMVAIEMGMFANANDPNNQRVFVDYGFGRRDSSGIAARIGRGIHFGCSDAQYGYAKQNHSYIGTVINVESNFDRAALDTTNALAIGGAPVLRMAEGHRISFTANNQNYLRYESNAYHFVASNGEVFNVNTSGDATAAGKVTGTKFRGTGMPISPAGLQPGDFWIDTGANNVIKVV